MSRRKKLSDVLIERIGEAAFVLERTLGAVIDEVEHSPTGELSAIESFEVIEATLLYHRRSGIGSAEWTRRGTFEDSAIASSAASARPYRVCGSAVNGEPRAGTAMVAERVIECGTRLHALSLLYGLLQRIAHDEGSLELAARAGLYRRDLVELGDEIERCLFGQTSLTGVINASGIVG